MDVLTPFEGRWRLYREIEDRMAQTELVFEGRAQLDRAGAGLTYVEDGQWTKSTWGKTRASRCYLWRAEGDRICVDYEDGRAFHSFAPGLATCESGHDCAPDRYDVTYRFHLPELWKADWRVAGPRKNYISRTRYTRETV